MWQANAPIESRYAPPQQETADPIAQQKQQLYAQAMGDLGQQQSQAKEGQRGSRTYSGAKKDSGNPMSSIMSLIGGGSNGNSSTMAGPDIGSFGAIG